MDANNPVSTPTLTDLYWSNSGIYITDGDSANDNILIDNIKLINATFGLHVKGTSNLTAQDSDFDTNGISLPEKYGHNIYLRRVSYAIVKDCNMTNAVSANGLNASYSDNVTVTGCNVYGNNFRGIRFADSSYIDIINNNVYNNGTDGIILNSESTGVTNFRVISNTVSDNGRYGIYVNSACSDGVVQSNVDGGGNESGYIKIDGSNVTQ